MSQLQAVREVADAVAQLAAEGEPVRMEIATPPMFQHLRAELQRLPAVRMVDLVPPAEYPTRLAEADLLLLPVVFDPVHLPYIRLSMQGKVSEYLVSGTPVLVYAPDETAVARHAQARGWAELVTQRDPVALRAAIRRLLHDPARRRSLAECAYEVGAAEFNAQALVPAFQATLRRVVNTRERAG